MKEFLKNNFKGDTIIWGIFIFLLLLSVVVMYSASSSLIYKHGNYNQHAIRHCMCLAASFATAFIIHKLPTQAIKKMGLGALFISICLLILISFCGAGVSENNATRWFKVGSISIQPSELLKLGFLTYLPFHLGRLYKNGASAKVYHITIATIGFLCFMIMMENLSTAILIGFITFTILVLGKTPWGILKKWIAIIFISSAAFATISYTLIKMDMSVPFFSRAGTWVARIERAMVDKDELIEKGEYKITDETRQIDYSLMAIANSEGIGNGMGRSVMRDYLALAYADFIFAIIVEEYGIIGALILIALYLTLLYRTLTLSQKFDELYKSLSVFAIGFLITIQALWHMAICLGIGPVTGQTLPLISHGGSSILIVGACFGVILNFSSNLQTNDNTQKGKKTEKNANEEESINETKISTETTA